MTKTPKTPKTPKTGCLKCGSQDVHTDPPFILNFECRKCGNIMFHDPDKGTLSDDEGRIRYPKEKS